MLGSPDVAACRPVNRVDRDTGAVRVKVFVITVLALLFAAVAVQAGLYFYARSVAASAAADAAREAADGDVPPGTAAARAEQRIHDNLADADADAITCVTSQSRSASSGLESVTVRCRGRIHVLLTRAELPFAIDVSTRALKAKQ